MGQDLSQSVSADTPRSIHQQVVFHPTPSSTPCLSGSLSRGLEESSWALKSTYMNELPHWLISGGRNVGNGPQVSCHIDLNIASTIGLTLGPSNHAIKNPIFNASDHFNFKNQADIPCKENTENISRTIQDTCQGSVHSNGGNAERSACFTIGELSAGVQDCESNYVKMITPMKNMGISDLGGKHLSTLRGVTHMSRSHSADKFVDRVVPFSWKDNLNVSLACDSIWMGNCILDENNVVKHGEIQARDGLPRPGILDNQDFDEQLLASTGHDCTHKPVHLHATACLTGRGIQMMTSKEKMISGQNDNISNINGAESRFSCSDTKQLGEPGFQFVLTSRKEFSCSLQLHQVENAGSVVDLSESTYLAAETLLKIRI
ncbi:hypothetical protein SUGI_0214330 [Cryptomeria japonica]|nr:hypothetical protein SUGI_0214330 [Cryptomeria japonica]